MCYKCNSGKWIVLGVLVLLNAILNFMEWDIFIGILLVIKGFLILLKPACGHEINEEEHRLKPDLKNAQETKPKSTKSKSKK